MRADIHIGDALEVLRTLPSENVHCLCCSPPFFAQRDYGVVGQLGLESTIEAYIEKLVAVFAEARRVLRRDGCCFVEIGDSFAGSWGNQGRSDQRGGQRPVSGPMIQNLAPGRYPDKQNQTGTIPKGCDLKPKDMCLVPFRLAIALQSDGWWVRSVIVWEHGTAMPESVTDRVTVSHSYVLHLTRSARYFYDAEAVKEPATGTTRKQEGGGNGKCTEPGGGIRNNTSFMATIRDRVLAYRNARSVWRINAKPLTADYGVDHFALYPEELPRRLILASTSERGVCPTCGAPWTREKEPTPEYAAKLGDWADDRPDQLEGRGHAVTPDGHRLTARRTKRGGSATADYVTIGWRQGCACEPMEPRAAVVLDPFAGLATTGVAAGKLGRDFVGIELRDEYARAAARRVREEVGPLLVDVQLHESAKEATA